MRSRAATQPDIRGPTLAPPFLGAFFCQPRLAWLVISGRPPPLPRSGPDSPAGFPGAAVAQKKAPPKRGLPHRKGGMSAGRGLRGRVGRVMLGVPLVLEL